MSVSYNIDVNAGKSLSVLDYFINRMQASGNETNKLNDKLKLVGDSSGKVFKKLSANTNEALGHNKRMTQSTKELADNLKRVNEFSGKLAGEFKKAYEQIDKIERKVDGINGKGNSSLNGGLLGGLGKKLLGVASIASVLSFGKSSIESAMHFEATKKSYEVLTGDRKQGGKLADDLNKLQQDTILGPEVFKAGQTLMGFGIAANKVMPIVKELGDIAMGDSQRFEALTVAFSQTQAAGRLMGQDLLQYINAGFNPLQTMSEHWKEFGFTAKKTVGDLKQEMEKGNVTSSMVAKAFEIATSKGGKFDGMMDKIADTSFGRLKILEGQWENFKIQAGNALMPLAEGLMTVANKTLNFLDLSKSASEQLNAEKGEINGLVHAITNLNESDSTRTSLMQTLIDKYPDLFANIDKECIDNNKLLDTLKDINKEYDKRINLASNKELIGTYNKEYQENAKDVAHYTALLNAAKSGDINAVKALGTRWEKANLFSGDAGINFVTGSFGNKLSSSGIAKLEYMLSDAKNKMSSSEIGLGIAKAKNYKDEKQYTLEEANKIYFDTKKQDELFKGRNADKKSFLEIAKNITDFNEGGNHTYNLLRDTNGNNLEKLKQLMNPVSKSMGDTGTTGGKTKGLHTMASNITGGGPKVVTINITKLVETLTIKTTNLTSGAKEAADEIVEHVLMALNSVNGKLNNE